MSDLSTAVDEAFAELTAAADQPAEAEPVDDGGFDEPELFDEDPVDGGEDADVDELVDGEDDGEVDEAEAEDDGEDSDEDAVDAVPVDAEATYTLPDGTEVSGAELRDGWLRQADYTRKTQRLAEQRREVETLYERMRDWYESRAADPAMWVDEIASQAEGSSPAEVLAETIGRAEDPTAQLAWVIRGLAERGRLDDQFVQQFGLESVVEQGRTVEQESRIERLERELQEERDRGKREQTQQQVLAQLNGQWEAIKDAEGLQYQSAEEESRATLELMTFARDSGIPNLEHAWAARHYRQQATPQQGQGRPSQPQDEQRRKQALQKKQKTRAVARKPTQQPAPRKVDTNDLDAVIAESARELGYEL